MIDTSKLKFYLIYSPETERFLKGSCYSGLTWTRKIEEAKVWLKLSTCRSKVTSVFNQFPDTGICDIIEIFGGNHQILSEKDRVEKSIEKKKLELINRDKRRLEEKQKRIEEELLKLQEELVQVKQKNL